MPVADAPKLSVLIRDRRLTIGGEAEPFFALDELNAGRAQSHARPRFASARRRSITTVSQSTGNGHTGTSHGQPHMPARAFGSTIGTAMHRRHPVIQLAR